MLVKVVVALNDDQRPVRHEGAHAKRACEDDRAQRLDPSSSADLPANQGDRGAGRDSDHAKPDDRCQVPIHAREEGDTSKQVHAAPCQHNRDPKRRPWPIPALRRRWRYRP